LFVNCGIEVGKWMTPCNDICVICSWSKLTCNITVMAAGGSLAAHQCIS